MSPIRTCTPEDLPSVARLFQAVFRGASAPPPDSLQQYLLELFFQSPLRDAQLPSLVYVDGEAVRGFIGVIPLSMSFRDKPIRAALASSIMVENAKETPLAGARLLRAFLSGPQDLSFSDDANATSVGMWRHLGAHSVPLESMEWLRVLRPAGFALSTAAKRISLLKLALPICLAIDGMATRLAGNRFRLKAQCTARSIDMNLNDDSLIGQLREFASAYALHPIWDSNDLKWLLNHAAQNRHLGNLVCRAVYGNSPSPLGCYLYFARARGVARVLQVMASAGAAGTVLDSLLHDADRGRCVAVRGRAHSRYIDDLFKRDCIFFNRGSLIVHSRRSDLVEAARSGDALVTGLAGEAWTRLAAGDVFK